MKYCKACHEIFRDDEVELKVDDPSPSGVSLPSGGYTYEVCPWCGSDDLGDAEECECCGKFFIPTDNEKFCNDCKDELDNAINELIGRIGHRWGKEGKDILFDRIEQRWGE